ncbi:alkaline phosphatase family protein [Snuella lapsa]|uniref:Alkaline phosphatase n=1 Tax=Snuella lapsa TaxID=870481 RepID=A0ABP6Y3M8_9FLAO
MKTRIYSSVFSVCIVAVMAFSASIFVGCKSSENASRNEPAAKQAKRVVIIGLDGLSVDGYKTAKHPNLDKLMADGVISFTTRTVMPSVTLPNWTSHLTGSGPEQHGVDGNGWTLDKHALPAIEIDSDGYYPSVFKILKDNMANMKTAYYYNWGNLIKPINQKYLDEVSFQEDDKYLENYNKALNFAKQNRQNPTLIFLYSVHTDHAGHKHKWMSPEYITAIEDADKAIGRLIEDFKSEGLYRDAHFLLITDHGGRGNGHGGMSPVEMNVPWAVTGPGIKKGAVLEEPNNNTNTAAVILRLFGFSENPKAWVGEVPESIFE